MKLNYRKCYKSVYFMQVAGVASYVPGRGGVYTSLFVSVHNHLGYIQGAMARLSNIKRKYPCFSVSENEDHHIY